VQPNNTSWHACRSAPAAQGRYADCATLQVCAQRQTVLLLILVLQAAAHPDKPEVLQPIIAAAAAAENKKRRRALEITFLSNKRQTAADTDSAAAAAATATGDVTASDMRSAAPAAAVASSSSDATGDDDDDLAGQQGAGDGGFEAGYSMQARQRIAEAPDDIAAELQVPKARYAAYYDLDQDDNAPPPQDVHNRVTTHGAVCRTREQHLGLGCNNLYVQRLVVASPLSSDPPWLLQAGPSCGGISRALLRIAPLRPPYRA